MGTTAANFLPAATGQDLGSNTQRWDGFLQNVSISGTLTPGTIALTSFDGSYFADKVSTGSGTSGDPWVGWDVVCNAMLAGECMYFRGGYYSTSIGIVPSHSETAILGSGWGAIVSYSGSGYAYDVDTLERQYMANLQLRITSGASGGVRYLHQTSSSEANHSMRRVFLLSSAWTSGQTGVLFGCKSATDSNYHNDIEIQTFNLYAGGRFVSDVNNNGPNGNKLYIQTNYHSIGVDVIDGTDLLISGNILGCHNLTGGIGFKFGGSGGGGYGTSNNTLGPFITEQGGTSTGVSYQSGSQLTSAWGTVNDSTAVSDTSGVLTNRSILSGLLYNGRAVSAFTCDQFNSIVNSSAVLAMNANNLRLGSSSNIRQADIWAGVKSNNFKRISGINNSTSDGTTFTSFNSAYGSWSVEESSTVTDTSSFVKWLYRNAGAGEGEGTSVFGLTNTGKVSTYGSVATVGNGLASEVAAVNLTSQGAAITTTTMFAVVAAGQYRVAWNSKVTTVDASSSTLGAMTIAYTDPDGVAISITAPATIAAGSLATTSTLNTTAAILVGLPLVVNCKAGTNITYAFAYISNTPGQMKYNLNVTCEAL